MALVAEAMTRPVAVETVLEEVGSAPAGAAISLELAVVAMVQAEEES